MTQSDLTARIDEQLAATGGHTPGEWRTSREDLDTYTHDESGNWGHVVYIYRGGAGKKPRIPVFATPQGNARADAALIASAPTLRALLVESAARIRDLEAQLAAQAEALAKYEGVSVHGS